jgi:hypothetical protein
MMHVGGHGFGITKPNRLSDPWVDHFENWLAAQG